MEDSDVYSTVAADGTNVSIKQEPEDDVSDDVSNTAAAVEDYNVCLNTGPLQNTPPHTEPLETEREGEVSCTPFGEIHVIPDSNLNRPQRSTSLPKYTDIQESDADNMSELGTDAGSAQKEFSEVKIKREKYDAEFYSTESHGQGTNRLNAVKRLPSLQTECVPKEVPVGEYHQEDTAHSSVEHYIVEVAGEMDFELAAASHGTDIAIVKTEPVNDEIQTNDFETTDDTHIVTEHRRIGTGGKPFKCSCGKNYVGKGGLTKHLFSYGKKKLKKYYTCTVCATTFCQQRALDRHMRRHTGERPYECTMCDKTFCEQTLLTRHVRSHTGQQVYTCPKCGETFTDKQYLTSHKRAHIGERPHTCYVCEKTFSGEGHLNAHKCLPAGAKPFLCNVCKKTFRYKNHLISHLRIHTGERPYACTVCGKAFSEQGSLSRHKRIHTGEKPYACTRCDKRYTDATQLSRHVNTHM